MAKYIVKGGAPLYGTVRVSGAKNSALPVLFASLSAEGEAVIENFPEIGDTERAIEILSLLGVKTVMEGERIRLSSEDRSYNSGVCSPARMLRASTYLLGACLSAFGRVELMSFGGCAFSPRPIDLHIEAALAFGAELKDGWLRAKRLRGTRFHLKKKSVGATVNSLILAANAEGESEISGAASEPHIDILMEFLSSGGIKLEREGELVRVLGGRLRSPSVRLNGDSIEAGTYLAASLLTGGDVRVVGADKNELSSFLSLLASRGTEVSLEDGNIRVRGLPKKEMYVKTAPYPGFPTDLQPIISTVMARGEGGRVEDTVWPDRFGYLKELSRQGLAYRLLSGRAELFHSEYKAAEVTATDLRGGAASLIAALSADGESVIDSCEIIKRGYSRLEEKISRLGGEITLIE